MQRVCSILIVAVASLLFAEPALACLCETSGSPNKDFDDARKEARAIFVGRAVKVVDVITNSDYSAKRVTLRVERYWKGQFNKEVIVFARRNDCETPFFVGEVYLVLAYVPDGERDLYTDHCMKTGLVRVSADALKWLGK